ncbi:hypothetical protein BABINDRAFT_162025 [Babjeviella inositovora NRRL Y-12698]|uniref:Glutathione S-transferase n=1 Tax=Babjeviella inositovora NRRL Y-12698 TaxID=984486 RepID=A0A1E3QPL2_9ASCO|nr:uncharacterized protein BABINDRAFT_162025 [Babjeviella inositovora NRRL Y-12698]ODQ79649.1 hypothetical protein BABINDRAFT_162025 [Babjeviella inositovora NRRL Y-12698]
MGEIILHHLTQSRSHRIVCLLKELDLPFEFRVYQRDPVTSRSPAELQKIHPLGKSPVIEDQTGKVISESGTITEFLVSKYGANSELKPATADEEFEIRHLMTHAEGSMQPIEVLLYVTSKLRTGSATPFFIRPIARKIADGLDNGYAAPDLKLQLRYLDGLLAKNGTGWFVGNHISGADIMYSFCVGGAFRFTDVTPEKYPHICKWWDMIRERPAYKAANEAVKQAESLSKKAPAVQSNL